jgi:hypothetical protein
LTAIAFVAGVAVGFVVGICLVILLAAGASKLIDRLLP